MEQLQSLLPTRIYNAYGRPPVHGWPDPHDWPIPGVDWTWFAIVETTLRAWKGSIGQAAIPASVSRSAFATTSPAPP